MSTRVRMVVLVASCLVAPGVASSQAAIDGWISRIWVDPANRRDGARERFLVTDRSGRMIDLGADDAARRLVGSSRGAGAARVRFDPVEVGRWDRRTAARAPAPQSIAPRPEEALKSEASNAVGHRPWLTLLSKEDEPEDQHQHTTDDDARPS